MNAAASVKRDMAFIIAAFLSFTLLGILGGAIVGRYSVAGGPWIGHESIAAMYWINWGGKVIGRFTGDLICGFLLGRYLRRLNPWHFCIGIALLVGAIIVLNGGFWDANDGLWVEAVGANAAVIQLVLQVVAMLGVVALGILYGRGSIERESDAENVSRVSTDAIAMIMCYYFALPFVGLSGLVVYLIANGAGGVYSVHLLVCLLTGSSLVCAARFFRTQRRRWIIICGVLLTLVLAGIVFIEIAEIA